MPKKANTQHHSQDEENSSFYQLPNVISVSAKDVLEDVQDEKNVSAKYLAIFIDETRMALDELNDILLNCEKGFDPQAFETLLITAHRIKGSAASIGLNRVAKLGHAIEDLLQLAREQKRERFPTHVYDLLLKCLDLLNEYIAGLRVNQADSSLFGFVIWELAEVRAQMESGTLDNKSKPIPNMTGPSDGEQYPTVSETNADSSAEKRTTTQIDMMSSDAARGQEPFTSTECGNFALMAPDATNHFVGKVFFQENVQLPVLKVQLVHEKLSRQGQLIHFSPSLDACEALESIPCITFALATEQSHESIVEMLHIGGVETIELKSLASDQPMATTTVCENVATKAASSSETTSSSIEAKTPTTSPTNSSHAGKNTTDTLRVDIHRLDHLMNLTGQLVINKSQFARIGDTLKTAVGTRCTSNDGMRSIQSLRKMIGSLQDSKQSGTTNRSSLAFDRFDEIQQELAALEVFCNQMLNARSMIDNLNDAVHQLNRISDGLQKSVMDTRMVPIGPLFSRFKRAIRDITRTNGKDIQLTIKGEKTELDKRMIDELGDPLIHMVRNSADHGIESPSERIAAGKSPRGNITLNAFHRGNHIVIEVIDDGKGLDPEKIKAKAIEKGIISTIDAERFTQQQIFNLIWEPGFSTAEKVTEISGRGMGMDIVHSTIDQLNGSVELSSNLGVGTTITIKLPLTLAIMPSLLSKFDGEVFAMPLESIVEIVQIDSKNLISIHSQKTAFIRGRTVSIATLNDLFQWNEPGIIASEDESGRGILTLVIIGDSGAELGIAVDTVLGESDIVIKSLSENYKNVPGISGASILGDGKVALILDSAALIEAASRGRIRSVQ